MQASQLVIQYILLVIHYQEIVELDEGWVQPVHGDLLFLAAILDFADSRGF